MKRIWKLLILFLALAVVAGAYIVAQNLGKPADTKEESGQYPLAAKGADELSGLSWEKDGAAFSFIKTDGQWASAEGMGFPVNQEEVQALADKLAGTTAARKLTGVKSMADYGLESPGFTVTAAWTDGTSTSYAMGAETPFKDGHYASASDAQDTVFILSDSLADAFAKTVSDLAAFEALSAPETVTRLTVGGALDALYRETSTVPDAGQHWYDAATGEALDGKALDALVSDVKGVTWEGLAAASATPEQLAEWSLGDSAPAITLYNGEEAALQLLVGGKDKNGNYYAKLPGSGMVYTASTASLDDAVAASAETLYRKAPFDYPFDIVKDVAFEAGASRWLLERSEPAAETAPAAEAVSTNTTEAPAAGAAATSPAESTEAPAAETASAESTEAPAAETASAEATEAPAAKVTLNGAETDAAKAEDLWAQLKALSATGRASAAAGAEAILTVTVTGENGNTAAYDFTAHDADSYLLKLSENTGLLFPADKVDKLIRMLRQF